MSKNEPTKRQQAAAQRKNVILEAAVTCFIENGYHQTGVRDIARKAGISLGNLYNYFAGKTAVLAEIARIERAELEPFLAILQKDAPAFDVLDAFVPAYTRHLSAPETVILVLEITLEAIREPAIADLFTESRTALIDALTRVLENGVQQGSMRSIVSPSESAQLILDIIESTAFRHGIEDVPLPKLLDNQNDFIRAALSVGD
ncbi:MAG: TetR/AcrR family transcriptional regulator [Pseudomonadota bacterium]